MKVTVIVTTYNNPGHLSKVLYGLLNQKRLPDELIVADDGSGEETARAIKDLTVIAPFPLLHVWHEHKDFRAAKIRNKAIRQSSGDYIVLLDGDCVVNSNFVPDHLTLAERGCFIQGKRVHVNKKAVAEFNHNHAGSFFELAKMALTGKISNVHHILRLPEIIAIKNNTLTGIKSCNMSFYRDDMMAINGFNEDFVGWGNEDSELACRFFKYGLSKKVHPFMAICFHLWHTTNKMYAADNNKEILMNTIRSREYTCKNGLFKK